MRDHNFGLHRTSGGMMRDTRCRVGRIADYLVGTDHRRPCAGPKKRRHADADQIGEIQRDHVVQLDPNRRGT